MSTETRSLERTNPISRRGFLGGMGVIAGAATLTPRAALAQAPPPGPATPSSTVTTPPRDFGRGAPPTTYVDPDVITVDPAFNGLRQGNTPILRLWTGALWSEGPAWSGQGRYLVWSDIPNNRQLRWTEDDGRVSVFRSPSNNANGNTFDFQGRQLSCEHLTRRVARRLGDDHRGLVQWQTTELSQRHRRASGRQLLVHRSPLRGPAVRGSAGRRRRAEQRDGPPQAAAGPAPRDRQHEARASEQRVPRRSERKARPRDRSGSDPQSQRAGLLSRLQEAVRDQHRPRPGRRPRRRQPRHARVRRGRQQQALQPEALRRLHDRRHQVRAGWCPR